MWKVQSKAGPDSLWRDRAVGLTEEEAKDMLDRLKRDQRGWGSKHRVKKMTGYEQKERDHARAELAAAIEREIEEDDSRLLGFEPKRTLTIMGNISEVRRGTMSSIHSDDLEDGSEAGS